MSGLALTREYRARPPLSRAAQMEMITGLLGIPDNIISPGSVLIAGQSALERGNGVETLTTR